MHRTKVPLFTRWLQQALDLDLPAAYAVRLIPVYLSESQVPIRKPHRGNALELAPSPSAVELSEPPSDPERDAARNDLQVRDLTENLRLHRFGHSSPGRH